MNVLSIATTYPRYPGDSEPPFVHLLNHQLCCRGHSVTALVPHAGGAKRVESRDGVEIRRYRYFVPAGLQRLCYDGGILPSLGRDWIARINVPFFLLFQFLAIWGALRRRTYDVVHCHWLIPQGLFCVFLKRFFGMRLVVSAHGGDIFTDNAIFRGLNSVVCRSSAGLTANSRGSKERMRQLGAGERVRIIPMGVDVNQFHVSRRDAELHRTLGDGRPQLLFVGRFAEKKGVRYCIDAMPLIAERLPAARLALVGFGPLEKELAAQIKKRGLEEKVNMPGRVDAEKIPGYIASADVFLVPSIQARSGDTEGLGVVLLEAMASGVAVVATAVGGITDIVKHEETGLACDQKDAEGLARMCVRIWRDEDLRRRCTERARKAVETKYSWSSVGRRFEELFREIP